MRHRAPLLDQEILTVEQAAEYLQVHKITLYRYIREGLLPAVRLGKMYRLFRRDVEAFLDAMRHQPDSDSAGGK
ncbi:MAG: helix-turn-helix domain-containing protein [bacterium]|nr:helix-turn-helix domain-containing protein [bacterium]